MRIAVCCLRVSLWCAAVVLLPSCSSALDDDPAGDATPDVPTTDEGEGLLSSPTGDDDAPHEGDGGPPAGSETVAAPEDVGDLSLVQCRVDDDCGEGLSCQTLAPGGICAGCGECPGELECVFGSCVRACESDEGCHPGFACSGAGRCALRACDEDTPCPTPFVCGDAGRCARPPCGPSNSCPAPFECDGVLCVEPA